MEHSKEYYYELARRWAEGTITPEEAKEYIEWFNQDDHEPLYIPPGFAGSREELNHRMLAIIQKSIEEQAPVISINKYRRARWVAAASIALLIAVGSYFFFFNHKSQITDHTSAIASNDVKAPAANRATITMSNGKIIYLDSVANGQLAIQNNVSLIKTDDGKISYRLTATSQQLTAQYNTLTNPRGSKVIDMTLSDGSHVWLNAGSSVTYPVAFIDNERKVTITGEAYFEVKHNEKMPFTVAANGVEVHDLGTSFNINAYDDEDAIRVTLLEGSVKVKSGTLEVKIKPGEQADIDPIHHSPFTI
ncbi:MAG TPA: FecR domain-containing protein, partial [Chitinophagaceae bacterium]|nr:FecR domain-containing protein [Chitinophagaceae bacterium]